MYPKQQTSVAVQSIPPKTKSKSSNAQPKKNSPVADISSPNIDDLIEEFAKRDSKSNIIIRQKQSKQDLARYLHATCLSPTVSTFTTAIANNNFASWPGLTTNLISKHLLKSIYTYQGHFHAEKQVLQSTKQYKTKEEIAQEEEDHFPKPETNMHRSNHVFYLLVDP